MALFGSSGSKSSSSTNVANNGNYGGANTNLTVGTLGGGKNSNVQLTLTDHAAVEGGLNIAGQALAANQSAFDAAIGVVRATTDSVISRSLDVASKNQTSESAQMQDTLVKLAVVGGIAFALWAYLRRKG